MRLGPYISSKTRRARPIVLVPEELGGGQDCLLAAYLLRIVAIAKDNSLCPTTSIKIAEIEIGITIIVWGGVWGHHNVLLCIT